MSAIKDKKRNTWTAQFYYTDSEGKRKRKRKRGFRLKRDALKFEKEFLEINDMKNESFEYYARLYLEDVKNRVKMSSYEQKKYLLESKIIPYFQNRRIDSIKPRDIRIWQNIILEEEKPNGKKYSQTYLKSINNQLNAVFNFAVNFYELEENPCTKAGSIGSSSAEEKKFWTLDEYYQFNKVVEEIRPDHSLAIEVLYFTGMRVGELLALTPADLDPINNTIKVRKTYQRLKGKDITTKPKTKKSIRDITIPPTLTRKLFRYITKDKSGISRYERIFPFSSATISYTIKKFAPVAEVPTIRVHDLRHSHVSLLVNLGFNANIIADRLGHQKIETTLGIYTHLYPSGRQKVSDLLEEYIIPVNLNDYYTA